MVDKWLSGRYWVNMVAGRRPASMVVSKEVGSDHSTVSLHIYEHAKTGHKYMKKQWGDSATNQNARPSGIAADLLLTGLIMFLNLWK